MTKRDAKGKVRKAKKLTDVEADADGGAKRSGVPGSKGGSTVELKAARKRWDALEKSKATTRQESH
jgi:hypothetical protein